MTEEEEKGPGWGTSEAESTKISAFEQRQREHVHYQPIGVRARNRQRAAARRHNGLKPMRFVSLHHHSTYSFLDGFQLPEAHVRRATEINMGAVAMTEHGNIFSHVKLERAAVAAGVKPIFGCEFYCGWTDDERRTQKKNHLTVIAKNATGYENLLALTERSWKEGFHYEPTVDWGWLEEHREGLVVLSGCQGGPLFTAAVGGKHVPEEDAGYKRALSVASWLAARVDDLYVEVQAFPELEKTCLAAPILARVARTLGLPLCATMDVHYTAPEEAEVQKILHNVRPGEKRTLEEQSMEWGYDVPLCLPPTDKVIYRRLRQTGLTEEQAKEAILSTEAIAQEVDVTLPRLAQVQFPLPEGYADPITYWRDLLRAGWKYRGFDRLRGKELKRYKEQLAREMEVIEAKGYVNYFLINAEAIVWTKEQQIPVGPARGSSAASLCCYLLRITEINPMDFDHLVFERFIDWSREDMPDIDTDFATYGRARVREHMKELYGEVSNVGTFTEYKSKNSLDDAARVYHVPRDEVSKLKELLIERSSGDLRASATVEDTVDQFEEAYRIVNEYPDLRYAMDLEGNVKAFGVHAAGLVVSTDAIGKVTAIIEKEVPKGSGNWIEVVAMDKDDAERQGLEKLDYLALSTMDAIAHAMRTLEMTVEELYAIPMDDEKVVNGFREVDVVGIFQYDGRATRFVCGEVKPDDFDEISLLVALSRPGPLHNGAVQGYTAVKRGRMKADYIHPALEHITGDTNGQIVYQEQIMRIVRDVGNFDWTGTAQIRKIIAKKLGEQEFYRQWSEFRDGALSVHERLDVPAMDEATAKAIWGMMTTAGAYAFNAAHSVSYGKIAYWSMWFKRYHPAAFYAAWLACLSGEDKLDALRRDAVRGRGERPSVAVLPPTVESGRTWRRESTASIRAGYEQLPGVGPKMADRWEEFANEHEVTAWTDFLQLKGVGPKTIEKVEEFVHDDDPFQITKLDDAIASVMNAIEAGDLDVPAPNYTAGNLEEAPRGERIYVLAQPTHRNLRDMFEQNRKKGVELDPATVKNPELSQWVVMTVRDSDAQASFIINRYKYPRFKETIFKMELGGDQLLLIGGEKSGREKGRQREGSDIVFVDQMWVIEP